MVQSDKKTLFIIGGASTALEIRETVDLYYRDEFKSVYNIVGDNEKIGINTAIRDSELVAVLSSTSNIGFILGFTNYDLRKKFRDIFLSFGGKEVTIVHPRAYLSPSAQIGDGVYIAPNCVISTNAKVEHSVIINMNVTVGHDACINCDTFLNPGARVSGHVNIGERCLVGAGAFIFQGLTIGNNCYIDALTYIDRDIPDNKLCTSRYGILKVMRNIYCK